MLLYAKDYGIIPDSTENSTRKIYKLLTEAADKNADVLFENGEYHFYPEFAAERVCCISNNECDGFKSVAMLFENTENITLDGGGSKFIFHDIIVPFMIENCKNITLKNFSIDYPKTLYAHSRVIESGEKYCIIEPLDDENLTVRDGRLTALTEGFSGKIRYVIPIDPALDDIRSGTGDFLFGDWFDNMDIYAEKVGENKIKMYGDCITSTPAVGDILLLGFGQRFAPGFFINESEDITLENITVHHCLGMGVLAQLTKNVTLRKYNVLPSPGRYISASADGSHFVECSGDITVDSCHICNQSDDPLNCHGIYMKIAEISSPDTILASFGQCDQMGLKIWHPGDKAEFIDRETLLTIGSGTVKSVKYISRACCEITFEENLPGNIKIADCIENICHTPNLTIKNCYFARNRARGPLITTRGKVLVEGNTFAMAGTAIRISGDTNSWFESGCVRDVTIRENKFINCNRCIWGRSVIDIDPEMKKTADECYHSGITITDNEFITFTDSLVYAKSVDGLVFKNNKIIKNNDFEPVDRLTEPVTLADCKNCDITL